MRAVFGAAALKQQRTEDQGGQYRPQRPCAGTKDFSYHNEDRAEQKRNIGCPRVPCGNCANANCGESTKQTANGRERARRYGQAVHSIFDRGYHFFTSSQMAIYKMAEGRVAVGKIESWPLSGNSKNPASTLDFPRLTHPTRVKVSPGPTSQDAYAQR